VAGPTERAFLATPVPTAGGRVIAAPFQFWTTGEDNLRVTSICSVVGVTLKLQGRFVGPDGVITAASWDHICRSDRIPASEEYPLAPGAILNLVVFAGTGAPRIGQTFTIVQLIRGRGAAAIVLGVLLQNYVTATQAIAWPGTPIENSLVAEPLVRLVVGTQPAAGVEITETVPTNTRWQLLAVRLRLETSAAVATRRVLLQIQDATNVLAQYEPAGTQTASQGFGYHWSANMPLVYDATNALAQQPTSDPLLMSAGDVMKTTTFLLQAGDQFQAPIYRVREWLEVT
jgi:hypothetical protein